MNLVLASLGILAAGAAASLLLVRMPRIAVGAAMTGIFSAGILAVIASVSVLINTSPFPTAVSAWPLPLGAAHWALDGLSAWFLMTIGLLAIPIAVYSPPYVAGMGGSQGVFGALLCALVASLILVVTAADSVLFLIGWEAMTLCAFFLVAFHHNQPEVRRGAWMYLVAMHLATALCVLPLFGVLFARAGTTEFAAFESASASVSRTTLMVLFALGLLGFGTKAGIMPMHVWLPAAHPVAPTPVSAFLSGVVVKTGLYAFLRLLSWLPPLPPICGYVMLAVGVVGGVMGVLYALAQHDLKRLLAYHTVENIGIIALGIAVGMLGQSAHQPAIAVLGYAGALLHVTNHALFKGLLFLSAGAVLHGTGTAEIERLGGLARKTPMNALMFLVGAVAICGLPPLNGFLSEWVVYGALISGSIHGVGPSGALSAIGLVSLALMGGLALACFAKVFGVVFLGAPRDARIHSHATPASMKAAMTVPALLCVLIGLFPGVWVPLTQLPAGQLARLPAAEVYPQMVSVLSPVATLSGLTAVLGVITLGLVLLRRWAASRAALSDTAVATAPTWGCGYTLPTPRMQYTASSFASTLIASFRGLLWPEHHVVAPVGPFPTHGRVETHTPDIAEQEVFAPLFRSVARFFAMIRTVSWTGEAELRGLAPPEPPNRLGPLHTMLGAIVAGLRRGSIQVFLSFIVLTLVVLFFMEAISAPNPGQPAAEGRGPGATMVGVDR